MRFPTAATVLALVGTAHAASSWTFADASVAVGKASDKVVER